MGDQELRDLERRAASGNDPDAEFALYKKQRQMGVAATPSWDFLRRYFAEIVKKAEGPSKGKSGLIRIEHSPFEFFSAHVKGGQAGQVHVELGTYDIADWPSWTNLGSFVDDLEARKAVANKLDEAEKAVEQEQENLSTRCPRCETDEALILEPFQSEVPEHLRHLAYEEANYGECLPDKIYAYCTSCHEFRLGEGDWVQPIRFSGVRMTQSDKKMLIDIPFENLRVGDRLIGANAAKGKIIKLDPGSHWSGGEEYTGWMEIEWSAGKISEIPQDDGARITYLGREEK